MFSANRTLGSVSQSSSMYMGSLLVLLLLLIVASPVYASKRPFTLPDDLALRIRLDDTLTTKDSRVGDPFSATVVDEGTYQNARVYGRITHIDLSGKIEGHTTMMLEFKRFGDAGWPPGANPCRNCPALSCALGREGRCGGRYRIGRARPQDDRARGDRRGSRSFTGRIFGGGKGAGIGSVVGGVGGLGTTAFKGHQEITLNSGLEMLIRTTGR